jgi:putative iron-dependent peroxidase
VQRKWLNWRQFDGLDDESDPVTGSEGRDFTWQRSTGPRRFADLPRFTTVCGGEYFFIPGIAAVRYLATTADF